MSSENISARFKTVIDATTNEARKFKELEEYSNIQSVSWRKAYSGGQRPTAEMLEILSRRNPEFAFWLVSGIDDFITGHVSPTKNLQNTTTTLLTAKYLKKRIEINELVHQHNNQCAIDHTGNKKELIDSAIDETIEKIIQCIFIEYPEAVGAIEGKMDIFETISIDENNISLLKNELEMTLIESDKTIATILEKRIATIKEK